MAAMFITKSPMFTLSKAFPQSPSTLGSAHKVSRVCFSISASKYGGTNPCAESRDPSADMAYSEAADRASRMSDTDDDALEETMEKAKQYANETKEKAKDGTYIVVETAENMTERTKKGVERASDTAQNVKEKAKEYAHDTKEKVKEGTQRVAETASDMTERAKEHGRGMMEKTADVVEDMADKATETIRSGKE